MDKRRYRSRSPNCSREEKEPIGFGKTDERGNILQDGYTVMHREPLKKPMYPRDNLHGEDYAGRAVKDETEDRYGSFAGGFID